MQVAAAAVQLWILQPLELVDLAAMEVVALVAIQVVKQELQEPLTEVEVVVEEQTPLRLLEVMVDLVS